MSCWAASIAMILGWKHHMSYADTTIAANSGGLNYMPNMKGGLDPNDHYMLRRNGFLMDAPMCYTRDLVAELLNDHGPLWVATAVPSPHIRVVTGIDGSLLSVNDPWPVNSGARYSRSVAQFFGRMEHLGAQELTEPNPVYVAYLS